MNDEAMLKISQYILNEIKKGVENETKIQRVRELGKFTGRGLNG